MLAPNKIIEGFRRHKWWVSSACISVLAYGGNWIIAEVLYARHAWHPGSPLHHWLATIQGAAGVVALVLGAVGARKDPSDAYALIAIMLAVICLGTATV